MCGSCGWERLIKEIDEMLESGPVLLWAEDTLQGIRGDRLGDETLHRSPEEGRSGTSPSPRAGLWTCPENPDHPRS